ncbi:MAG: glycosyltransferase family 4 protein [Bacteroidia bacterium]|nr:glycosyltransferase family 4 protein [Bacteroidia bacterium]
MKVVHINKGDAGGGASVAALRIHRSLLRAGVDSHILVQEQRRNEENEHVVGTGFIYKMKCLWRFLWERISFLPNEKEKALRFAFSPANTGLSIASLPVIQEADIIHLHWINQGYLSIASLEELFSLGKPIVWTLHDMWPFTGGCHYAGNCLEFNEKCGFCPLLKNPSINDISAKIYQKKKKLFSKANLNIVTCSRWLGSLAKSSSLFRNSPIYSIPNPIDTKFYTILDRAKCREELGLPQNKSLLLFGAANILDTRKGFRYLYEALTILSDSFPSISSKIELVVFGKSKESVEHQFPFKTHSMQFVSDPATLVKLYNACNLFILPSLQDNLPNTVVECLCCGTPVAGFRIGGVPEMIDHNISGYLAEIKNSLSLANGINTVLFTENKNKREDIRESAIKKFDERLIAEKYIEVYESAMKNGTKKIR